MDIDTAKKRLEESGDTEFWTVLSVAVKGDGGFHYATYHEPPATANPVLMYGALIHLSHDIDILCQRIYGRVHPDRKHLFLKEVERFVRLSATQGHNWECKPGKPLPRM